MQLAGLFVAVLSSASLASAACPTAPPTVPQCATSCIASVGSAVGCNPAGPIDQFFACQCKHTDSFSKTAAPCIVSACGPTAALQVSATAVAVCSACNS